MRNSPLTASTREKVIAACRNPAIYELAKAIPEQGASGRSRTYPSFVWLLWQEFFSIFGTHRAVERELGRGGWWDLVRREVRGMFPDDPSMWLPSKTPRRQHFEYYRNRYMQRDDVAERLLELHRQVSGAQAAELGILDPTGEGSVTHPAVSRTLYGDGKVITPSIGHSPAPHVSTVRPVRSARYGQTQTQGCMSKEMASGLRAPSST